MFHNRVESYHFSTINYQESFVRDHLSFISDHLSIIRDDESFIRDESGPKSHAWVSVCYQWGFALDLIQQNAEGVTGTASPPVASRFGAASGYD
jgi:hypothetical protein